MLEQSFTAENCRKIFDYENRKGINLEGEFFPEVAKITDALKACNQKMKGLKRRKLTLPIEDYKEEKDKLRQERRELKQKREKLLSQELEKISAQITDKGFEIKLRAISSASGKATYSIEDNPASYFAVKQIQYNFQKLYRVKQSNRYDIVRQLTSMLDNNLPKYLIRTDIHGFYENIPRSKVLEKINNDPLLTHISKKLIRNILVEYGRLSASTVGIPRGVGVSAYLSELHMRGFDDAIRNHPEVVYYGRYVDDIVVVFFPKAESRPPGFLDFIRSEVRKDGIGLELNDGEDGRGNKTQVIDLQNPSSETMEYLGYRMEFGAQGSKTKLHLSGNKMDRYRKRIDKAFEQYEICRKINRKAAARILVKRILFLSGNTRLIGNKRHALVGIYFSNSLLTVDSDTLVSLDDYLRNKVSVLDEVWLKKRLSKMSFKEGFQRRRFARFSTNELAEIVKAWRHEA